VVPDPNSPTGWSQITTTSDGTEVGRVGGITPPAPIIARAQAILKARKEQGWDPTPEEEQAELWRMIGPNGSMFGPGTGGAPSGSPGAAEGPARPGPNATTPPPSPGVSTSAGERREGPPGQGSADHEEAILNPLPAPNRRLPPATAKQLSVLDEQNKQAAQAVSLIRRARELNPYAYYFGMGNVLGGPPSNARWFPHTQAQADAFFNPEDPRAKATLEYPTVVKQLAAMSAKQNHRLSATA
jgi:hypothetical protein